MPPRAGARLLYHIRRLAAPPAPDPGSDEELLTRFVARRDEAAFAAIVARHGPMVLRLCRRVLADAHAAEDCFQATFLVLARKAASVRRRTSLAAWLYGVAVRVSRKARHSGRRAGVELRPQEAPADPRPDPLGLLTARELLAAVDEEVRRLPEVYRLPIILCCLEGRTREEAAARLGWTEGAVKGRLERGARPPALSAAAARPDAGRRAGRRRVFTARLPGRGRFRLLGRPHGEGGDVVRGGPGRRAGRGFGPGRCPFPRSVERHAADPHAHRNVGGSGPGPGRRLHGRAGRRGRARA